MIFAIKRFAIHDGDGIRTTVFFKGCPMNCKWCHNPEALSQQAQLSFDREKCVNCGSCSTVCNAHIIENGVHKFKREKCIACGRCVSVCPTAALMLYGKEMTADELFKELICDKIFYEASDGGVTVSGGEPLEQADFCAELFEKLKSEGINTAVDTCGYTKKENIDKVLRYTDTFLYDIKAIDEKVHLSITGKSNAIILENLKYIDSKNKNIEIRIPYVPGVNSEQISKIGEFIKSLNNVVRVRVLPYHRLADRKYACLGYEYKCENVVIPKPEDIDNAIEKLKSFGISAMRSED